MSDNELGVEAGQVIGGKYKLQELLGRGGMGSVWRCDHLTLMSTVALKIIKPEVAKNQNSVLRFMREAKAAALLRSPHVVQIFDHGIDGKIAFIAMEVLEGESLLRRIKRQHKLTAAETSTIMTHVARAMQKAHDAGIIHRDLKPDNIFLVHNDDEVIAKVLDFGIAKSALWALNTTNDSPQTQTGALLGTPYYMSPEQATGQKDVDHRADLWALGVITFECLVGRRPYQSDALGDLVLQICSRPQPVPSHFARVPMGFDDWFARSQKREPDERFQSAKEMSRVLREVLTGSGASVPLTLSRGSQIPTPIAGTPLRALEIVPETAPMPVAPPISSPGFLPTVASSPGVAPPSHPSASGRHSAATPMEGTLAAAGVASERIETLDALAATTSPKRRRTVLVGALVAGACLVGGGSALYFLRADTSPSAEPARSEPAPAGSPSVVVTSTPAARPAPAPVAVPEELIASASAVASSRPSARPAPQPVPPQPTPHANPVPVPVAPTPRPPTPKPKDDDPLGI